MEQVDRRHALVSWPRVELVPPYRAVVEIVGHGHKHHHHHYYYSIIVFLQSENLDIINGSSDKL